MKYKICILLALCLLTVSLRISHTKGVSVKKNEEGKETSGESADKIASKKDNVKT